MAMPEKNNSLINIHLEKNETPNQWQKTEIRDNDNGKVSYEVFKRPSVNKNGEQSQNIVVLPTRGSFRGKIGANEIDGLVQGAITNPLVK